MTTEWNHSKIPKWAHNLPRLDLSSFDTTRAVDFTGIFENCKNLHTLRLGSRLVIRADAATDNMFSGCEKLDKSHLQKTN